MLDPNINPINEVSEIGEALKELNNDDFNDKHQSKIDMRTRLGHSEISAILATDLLVVLGALPEECHLLTQQKKRLAVSLSGLGRTEIVKVVQGEREREEGTKGKNLFNMLGMGNKKQ